VPCNEPRIFQFPDGHGPADYTLTISGPKGAFTASAEFLAGGAGYPEYWPPSEVLAPAKKIKRVFADNACVVQIPIFCVATKSTPIRVEATLGLDTYCHEIPCVADQTPTVINIMVRR
jgi:hypothetical protein